MVYIELVSKFMCTRNRVTPSSITRTIGRRIPLPLRRRILFQVKSSKIDEGEENKGGGGSSGG
jgi:hypothetical protein